jgi:hypothetical protein
MARAHGSCTAQASKTKLASNYPDIKKMDKKGRHTLLCKSALHKSLACKNWSSFAGRELCILLNSPSATQFMTISTGSVVQSTTCNRISPELPRGKRYIPAAPKLDGKQPMLITKPALTTRIFAISLEISQRTKVCYMPLLYQQSKTPLLPEATWCRNSGTVPLFR